MQKLQYISDTQNLDEKTFVLYAAKHYDNPHCHEMEEFYNDLSIPMHLKKLFTRYNSNDILKDRLILNHIISFFNVFEPLAACKILFFKMNEEYYSYLKTFLVFLNRCPSNILIDGKVLDLTAIEVDDQLMAELEKI